jgi:hypothetical protein
LKNHYIDPKIMSAVEKAALEVRVFGKNWVLMGETKN